MDGAILYKLLAIFMCLIMTLLGGLLPLRFRSDKVRWFLNYANAFSGGVFLSVGLLHMLPEATDLLDSLAIVEYPLSYAITITGFLVVFFIEKVIMADRSAATAAAGHQLPAEISVVTVPKSEVTTYSINEKDVNQTSIDGPGTPSKTKKKQRLKQHGVAAPGEEEVSIATAKWKTNSDSASSSLVIHDSAAKLAGKEEGDIELGVMHTQISDAAVALTNNTDTPQPSTTEQQERTSDTPTTSDATTHNGHGVDMPTPTAVSANPQSPTSVPTDTATIIVEPTPPHAPWAHRSRARRASRTHGHTRKAGAHGHSHITVPAGGGGSIMPYILAIVLSIHSTIAGIALGVQETASSSLILFIAIASHKWIEAFAFGTSFVRAGVKLVNWMGLLLLYTTMTPIGITLGIVLVSFLVGRPSAIVQGVAGALAAGTFIYIALVDIVAEEFSDPTVPNKRKLFVMLIAGVALMAIVAIWV